MKERIQELMKQAGTDVSGKWMGVDHATKFAELIVEECLDILDDEDDGSHDGRSVRIAAIRIKKLFGVEE
jgi:hypothetical protein